MKPSPGHRKWPDHKVEEKPISKKVCVEIDGELIAESTQVIELDEDNFPPRYYIPKQDIDLNKLSDSNTSAHCPFKGEGHYYNINFGSKRLEDAAWAYDDPYEEHHHLKNHIAFHDEIPQLALRFTSV